MTRVWLVLWILPALRTRAQRNSNNHLTGGTARVSRWKIAQHEAWHLMLAVAVRHSASPCVTTYTARTLSRAPAVGDGVRDRKGGQCVYGLYSHPQTH
jgi:hypothetical protein